MNYSGALLVTPTDAEPSGSDRLPDAFEEIHRERTTLLVRRSRRDCLLDWGIFDLDRRMLADDARSGGVGRARHVSLAGPAGERLFVREYRHGGLLGGLFGQRFLGAARPRREISISERARAGGVSSPEVVACVGVRGLLFHRWRMLQVELLDCDDLVVVFLAAGATPDVTQARRLRDIVRSVARQVRLLHDLGVFHADLHVKNIMVRRDGCGEPILVDLDKSTHHGRLGWNRRFANLIRLDRSVEKLNLKGAGISRAMRLRFLRAYLRSRDELDSSLMRRLLDDRRRALRRHGFGWRLGSLVRSLRGDRGAVS